MVFALDLWNKVLKSPTGAVANAEGSLAAQVSWLVGNPAPHDLFGLLFSQVGNLVYSTSQTTGVGYIRAKNLTINSGITLTLHGLHIILVSDLLTNNGIIRGLSPGSGGRANSSNTSNNGFPGQSASVFMPYRAGRGQAYLANRQVSEEGDASSLSAFPSLGEFLEVLRSRRLPETSRGFSLFSENSGGGGGGGSVQGTSGSRGGGNGGISSFGGGGGGGGGASGVGAGGDGGSVLIIICDRFNNRGTINCSGGVGGAEAGGGGGGAIFVLTRESVAQGTLNVGGGAAGSGSRASAGGTGFGGILTV